MSVNANKLVAMRDFVQKQLDEMGMHEHKADLLVELTALNVLVNVAKQDNMCLENINTLTQAGFLIRTCYRK